MEIKVSFSWLNCFTSFFPSFLSSSSWPSAQDVAKQFPIAVGIQEHGLVLSCLFSSGFGRMSKYAGGLSLVRIRRWHPRAQSMPWLLRYDQPWTCSSRGCCKRLRCRLCLHQEFALWFLEHAGKASWPIVALPDCTAPMLAHSMQKLYRDDLPAVWSLSLSYTSIWLFHSVQLLHVHSQQTVQRKVLILSLNSLIRKF